ncbi:hypothetical protein HNQ51_002769 [Inhella inkyongensis]|uniref:Ankyrin repeat domain-containing protein n=1 Tax=Inhella inkyongensis TaxID=392593 RepID=A0A840SAP5_9BURK|nr:ankyrin repeat domain-containing protein [Inhella inkyongensis]MBB5205450.1 hypothetical protein [Inhella inkyongensis]
MKRRNALANGALGVLGALGAALAVPPAWSQAWNDPVLTLFRYIDIDSGAAVAEMLRAGQDPNVRNDKGQRPLHWALMQESAKSVKALLAEPRTDVEAVNDNDERPLMIAALRGRLDWAQALVARGAAIDPQRGERRWSALHYAGSGPDNGVAKWLVEQGAELDARSTNGTTPLMMALGYGSLDTAVMLLARGANWNARNDLGFSPWDFGRRAGKAEAMRRLGLREPDTVSAKP